MIQIYDSHNENYEFNGDITLAPTECVYVARDRVLTLVHPKDDLGRWKYIKNQNVIAVDENGKRKLYRIYNSSKSLYSITALARPIFYDLAKKVLFDVRPTNKSAQDALDIIFTGTKFKGHSNLSSIATAHYIRKNIVRALVSDDDNSFINKWGGEVYIDNFDIYINEQIGSDNNISVEFGYNLDEIEENVDDDSVVTRIIPVAANGIMLDPSSPYVDSPIINNYCLIKEDVITFEDVKLKESEEDEEGYDTLEEVRAELIRRSNLLFEEGIDKPLVNYVVDMVNLSNTTEYENYKQLLEVEEGDIVTCRVKDLGIDVKARVIDYEKDLITGEYITIELGNEVHNFIEDNAKTQDKVESILNNDGSVKGSEIKGFLDATKTKLKAQKEAGQLQDVRAFIWEDLDPNSLTYGCMVGGSAGIQISQQRTPDGRGWDFTSAFTAEGLIADKIVGRLLSSKNGATKLWMDTGTFESELPDGSKIVMSPSTGFYNQFGDSKREYHHLSYSGSVTLPDGADGAITSVIVNLPSEFRGKNPTISVSISRIDFDGGGIAVRYVTSKGEINKDNNTAKISGSLGFIECMTNVTYTKNSRLTISYNITA